MLHKIESDHQAYPPKSLNAFKRAVWSAVRTRTIHRDWGMVLICLVERCRIPGRDRCAISLTELHLRTRVQRQDLVDATRWAEDHGLLERIKRRVRVWCEALGRFVGRQATTVYRFCAPSEYGADTATLNRTTEKKKEAQGEGRKAKKGLVEGSLLVMASRLVRWERSNPAMMIVVRDAIRAVLSVPRPNLGGMMGVQPYQTAYPQVLSIQNDDW